VPSLYVISCPVGPFKVSKFTGGQNAWLYISALNAGNKFWASAESVEKR
jgi:hypothetical protein